MTTRYVQSHLPSSLNGPGDSRPTAQQIINDNNLVGALRDKVFLVTGTSSGIGIPTVAALASTGAKVYAAARDLTKARNALAETLSGPNGKRVELLELDTGSFASVRACADAFLAKETKLNVLINNAGVMAIPERRVTKDGFEEQFEVNYLGPFLLFHLLKPALLAASTGEFQSRVVNVSSSGHRQFGVDLENLNWEKDGSYHQWKAYGQSKSAMIYMTHEIERRFGGEGLHGISLNPGGIETPLQVHVQDMMVSAMQSPDVVRGMKSVDQGAATTMVAALDRDMEGKGAVYLHDCAVQEVTESKELGGGGYAPWIDDVEMAGRVWEESLELVGMKE